MELIKVFKSGAMRTWISLKSVALEVSSLLFMTSVLMTYLISQDFVMMRACRVDLNYSNEICDAVIQNNHNGNYSDEETAIQKVMTGIRRVRSILDYTIPVLFVIFQGSWSDIYGRKIPLLLPCIGFFLQAVGYFACDFFPDLDAMTIVLMTTIMKSVTGADVTYRMAALSHISDISSNSQRTVRTGLITAAFTIGVPVGFAIGGAALKAQLEPKICFLIAAGISALAFSIILVFVENKRKHLEGTENLKAAKQQYFTVGNFKSIFKSLVLSFDGLGLAERVHIFVLIFVIICINAPIQGEFGIMYLYLRRKLLWDSGDYGIFSTYVSLVGVGGTVMSMGVLCSLLKLTDPVIGLIAGLSQFGGCFMYAFAYNNAMIYLAPAVDMLNGTMAVVAKSMLSKLCPPDAFGKMFSFLAVVELLVPLVFDPTYSTIYELTMESFPGAVFLLSAAMTVPPQLTYLFYVCKNWKTRSCEITTITKTHSARELESQSQITTHKCKFLESLSGENYVTYSRGDPVSLKAANSTTTVDTVVF